MSDSESIKGAERESAMTATERDSGDARAKHRGWQTSLAQRSVAAMSAARAAWIGLPVAVAID